MKRLLEATYKAASYLFIAVLLVFAQLTPLVALMPQKALAAEQCIKDTAGADDLPGQKDLTRMCQDLINASSGNISVKWNWDDTGWSGNNSGDACALFDTDNDGNVNYSLCVVVKGDPADIVETVRYICSADSRPDRCGGPGDPLAVTSTCDTSVLPDQPFSEGSDTPDDTVAECLIQLSDVGGAAQTKLIDVCSYPSQQPNSDPSDCIVYRSNSGKLEVKKVLPVVGDTGTFDLKIDGTTYANDVGNNGTTGEQVVTAGSRVVSETPGANLTDLTAYSTTIVCKDLNGTGTVVNNGTPTGAGSRQLTLNVPDGSDIVCTITNTLATSTVTLVKQVNNDNGGTLGSNDFGLTINGQSVNSGQSVTVNAGSSVVLNEANVQGYSFVSLTGTGCPTQLGVSFTVTPGQSYVCTITNTDNAPSLTLLKVVKNDNGGQALNTAWTLNAVGSSQSPTNLSGTSGVNSGTNFKADTYTLSESGGPTGYSASNWSCTNDVDVNGSNQITLPLGTSTTCTITNDDQAGTLVVNKVVINNNGGNKVPSDFGFKLNDGNTVSFEADGSNTMSVPAGTYTISEPSVAGYSTSYSNCENVVVPNGGTVVCTITNNDIEPSLTLVKSVINNNGGQALNTAWTLNAVGSSQSPTNLSGTSGVNSGTNFKADTYTLSESGGPTGYSASNWSCTNDVAVNGSNQITLPLGTSTTCTITNDDIAPLLTVFKSIMNDDGGTLKIPDFPLFVDSTNVSSGTQNSFNSGMHTISETQAEGYQFTGVEGDCYIDELTGEIKLFMGIGGVYTCTLNNDDIAPTVTLVKVVINDDGRELGVNDFGLSISGASVNSGEKKNVKANTPVTLNEVGALGYQFVSMTGTGCPAKLGDSVSLSPGQNIVCTITNDDQPVDLNIDKDDSDAVSQEGETFNYTLTIKNISNYPATNLVLTDNIPTNLKVVSVVDGDWSCNIDNKDAEGYGGTLFCSLSTLGGNTTAPLITLVVEVQEGSVGQVVNTSTVISKEVDSNPNDNTDTEITPLKSIDIVVTAVCRQNFPYLDWSVTPTNVVPTKFTFDWLTVAGNDANDPADTLVSTNVIQANDPSVTQSNGTYSGTLLWPGSDLNTPDWPGWDYINGIWVENPNDLGGNLRPAGKILITVNPTSEDAEIYPPATPVCNPNPPATLTLVKEVINNNGGQAKPADWLLTATNGTDTFSGTSGAPSVTNIQLPTGTQQNVYSLYEDEGISGYSPSDWSCKETNAEGYVSGKATLEGNKLTVTSGANVTCTITNDDDAPLLTVEKVTVPSKSDTKFPFNIENQGENFSNFNLADGESYSTGFNLSAGIVKVTESPTEGWFVKDIDCVQETNDGDISISSEFTAELGAIYRCVFTNEQYGKVTVTKFHDINENGLFDENEPTLAGWDMNLSRSELDTYTLQTSEDGSVLFNNIVATEYYLSETLKDDWSQSAIYCENTQSERTLNTNKILIDLNPGQEIKCFVGNYRNPHFSITKTNDQPNPVLRGTKVKYTITVTVPDPLESGNIYSICDNEEIVWSEVELYTENECYGEFKPVTVTDITPENVTYIPDSWTANMVNEDGEVDLKALGVTTEPTYASPGVWKLTNPQHSYLKPGTVITLSYLAEVLESASVGIHYDAAFSEGYSIFGNSILASGKNNTPFVGTQISVIEPAPTTDYVSGTTTLVDTGDNGILGVIIGIALISGAILIYKKKGTGKSMKGIKVLAGLLALPAVLIIFGSSVKAVSPVLIQLNQPTSPTNVSTFNLDYTIIAVDPSQQFDVVLYQNGSPVSSQAVTHINGNSGSFPVTLNVDGNYTFTTKALVTNGTDTGTEYNSSTVNVTYDGTQPLPIVYGGKTVSGNTYTFTFTAPSGSDAVKANIYASTSKNFPLNASTLVGSIAITPGVQQTFSYTAPTSETYYFAAQVVDSAGNVSTASGDSEVVIVSQASTSTSSNATNDLEQSSTSSSTEARTQVLGDENRLELGTILSNNSENSASTENVSGSTSGNRIIYIILVALAIFGAFLLINWYSKRKLDK